MVVNCGSTNRDYCSNPVHCLNSLKTVCIVLKIRYIQTNQIPAPSYLGGISNWGDYIIAARLKLRGSIGSRSEVIASFILVIGGRLFEVHCSFNERFFYIYLD